MRKIKYKENSTDYYQTYIDIGACEKHYKNLPLYEEEIISYVHWYSDFINYPLGVQMLTINYYLLQLNTERYIPDTLNTKIIKNRDILTRFIQNWFEVDTQFFKGLDFNWEDINDEIVDKIENIEGDILKVKFKDGSSICFIDDDNTIQSFYVKEIEYEKLKQEFVTILEILK
jgi:hypothetical protein